MMKVVWFTLAIRDVELVKDYIIQDNHQAAQRMVSKIKDKLLSLSEQPGIGRSGRVPNTK